MIFLTGAKILAPQCNSLLGMKVQGLQSMRNLHLGCKEDYPTLQLALVA